MPIYEYACESCGFEFEELARSPVEGDRAVCPKCGAKKTTRKMSVFAAHNPAPAPSGGAMGGCGRCGDPSGPCSA